MPSMTEWSQYYARFARQFGRTFLRKRRQLIFAVVALMATVSVTYLAVRLGWRSPGGVDSPAFELLGAFVVLIALAMFHLLGTPVALDKARDAAILEKEEELRSLRAALLAASQVRPLVNITLSEVSLHDGFTEKRAHKPLVRNIGGAPAYSIQAERVELTKEIGIRVRVPSFLDPGSEASYPIEVLDRGNPLNYGRQNIAIALQQSGKLKDPVEPLGIEFLVTYKDQAGTQYESPHELYVDYDGVNIRPISP